MHEVAYISTRPGLNGKKKQVLGQNRKVLDNFLSSNLNISGPQHKLYNPLLPKGNIFNQQKSVKANRTANNSTEQQDSYKRLRQINIALGANIMKKRAM